MQVVLVLALTLVFLVLSGMLWYVRPSPNQWLFGSLALGAIWGVVFMRLIASGTAGEPK